MKGLEKSMTFSRSAVMVNAATARSAFCWRGSRVGQRGGQGDRRAVREKCTQRVTEREHQKPRATQREDRRGQNPGLSPGVPQLGPSSSHVCYKRLWGLFPACCPTPSNPSCPVKFIIKVLYKTHYRPLPPTTTPGSWREPGIGVEMSARQPTQTLLVPVSS